MRDALHQSLKPIKDKSGAWWLRVWTWPKLLRECHDEINQLHADLSMVREKFRTEQARSEQLSNLAEESRELCRKASEKAHEQIDLKKAVIHELENAKVQLQKSSETVSSMENRINQMELDSEKLKAAFSNSQAQLSVRTMDLEKEKSKNHEARIDNTLLRELVHRLHRLEIPTRRGIKALLANGKRVAAIALLLLPMCLFAQFPPPFWRNAWTTNTPPRAVYGQDNLSVTNAGGGTNWLFYEVGPKTIARLGDVTNIASSFSGGGGLTTNANQFLGVPLSIKAGAFQTNMNFWSTGTNHGDLYLDGNLLPIADDTYTLGSASLAWGNLAVRSSGVKFFETGGGANNVGIQAAAAMGANYSLVLPDVSGADGTVMTNNGAGALGWWDATSVIAQKQFGSAVLTNLVATVANNVTNVVSLSTTNATSKPLTNSYSSGVLTLFGLEQGANITLTPNGSNIVIASTASGSGLSTNANQFAANTTLNIKSGALLTNILFYPSNVTGPSAIFNATVGIGTNLWESRNTNGQLVVFVNSNIVLSASNTDIRGFLTNQQLTASKLVVSDANKALASSSFSDTDISNLQGATNGLDALVKTKQNGSATLTNLSGTGAVTNLFNASLSNATIKPTVFGGVGNAAGMTNTTGQLYGLEAGTGVTLTPNGSNITVSTTVTGAATNANQFGASTVLTLKDGLLTTNLNNFGVLSVTNAPGLDRSLRLWNTNAGGFTEFSVPTNAWFPTNKLLFAITNPSSGQVLKFLTVSLASGVASIVVTNDSDNNPTLTTNANQFSGVPLSIKDGALFTNLNNFSILSVTNQPGLDRGLRFWHTNGQAYTELSGPTNQWLPTNKFFLTITNPVANQVLKFQNVSYANGVASIVLTNDSDSAGTGTNMLIQTNGTDLGIAGTVNWTTGVTGYLAGVVANLGVSASGGSSTTNFDSIIITNQVLYQKQHFKSAGSGANTNQVDLTLATHKGFTNALTTNIVCQLTNITQGASCVLSIYGADGTVIASNYTVKVTAASGTTLYWLTTTNGNLDFIVTSNKAGLLSLFADRSTNVFAAWREQVP